MAQLTDTALAHHGNLTSTIDPPDAYRSKTRLELQKYVDLYGIASLVDKLNKMTEVSLTGIRDGTLLNHDIFIAEVRQFFDLRYPSIKRPSYRSY